MGFRLDVAGGLTGLRNVLFFPEDMQPIQRESQIISSAPQRCKRGGRAPWALPHEGIQETQLIRLAQIMGRINL